MNESQIQQELEALRAEVAELRARLDGIAAPKPAPAVAPSPKQEQLSQETLFAISAAVAAYLGYKARVRHVRYLGRAEGWGVQGRVAIQGSHNLSYTPRGSH